MIPSSIRPGTLWVCARDHWHIRGVVLKGSTALLTEVRQEDGTVEYLRGAERIRMDWDSFTLFYAASNRARDAK